MPNPRTIEALIALLLNFSKSSSPPPLSEEEEKASKILDPFGNKGFLASFEWLVSTGANSLSSVTVLIIQFLLFLIQSNRWVGLVLYKRRAERGIGERAGYLWDLIMGSKSAEGLWLAMLFRVAMDGGAFVEPEKFVSNLFARVFSRFWL